MKIIVAAPLLISLFLFLTLHMSYFVQMKNKTFDYKIITVKKIHSADDHNI